MLHRPTCLVVAPASAASDGRIDAAEAYGLFPDTDTGRVDAGFQRIRANDPDATVYRCTQDGSGWRIVEDRLYGIFSARAWQNSGGVLYKTPEGSTVRVTAVTHQPEGDPAYAWPDAVLVGEVIPVEQGGFVERSGPQIQFPLIDAGGKPQRMNLFAKFIPVTAERVKPKMGMVVETQCCANPILSCGGHRLERCMTCGKPV
jgi:hypothetical protein